ncbi:MAG TPA: hypothetical protein DCP28_36860 [Cytophagales bacterium]|nr:hypothetical protein [Cytophagales bacterium]
MKALLFVLFWVSFALPALGQEYQLVVESTDRPGKPHFFKQKSGIILFLKDSTAKRINGYVKEINPEYVTVGKPLFQPQTVAWDDVAFVGVRNPWHTAFRYIGIFPLATAAMAIPVGAVFIGQGIANEPLFIIFGAIFLAGGIQYGVYGSIPYLIPRRRLRHDRYVYRFEIISGEEYELEIPEEPK